MAKEKGTVSFNLPQDFTDILIERANNEFTRAQHVWGINVESERKRVISISIEQLVDKVATMGCCSGWFEYMNHMEIIIDKASWVGKISLPASSKEDEKVFDNIYLSRPRNTWICVPEPDADSITLNQLPQAMWDKMCHLIETAVFYGVASYKDVS